MSSNKPAKAAKKEIGREDGSDQKPRTPCQQGKGVIMLGNYRSLKFKAKKIKPKPQPEKSIAHKQNLNAPTQAIWNVSALGTKDGGTDDVAHAVGTDGEHPQVGTGPAVSPPVGTNARHKLKKAIVGTKKLVPTLVSKRVVPTLWLMRSVPTMHHHGLVPTLASPCQLVPTMHLHWLVPTLALP